MNEFLITTNIPPSLFFQCHHHQPSNKIIIFPLADICPLYTPTSLLACLLASRLHQVCTVPSRLKKKKKKKKKRVGSKDLPPPLRVSNGTHLLKYSHKKKNRPEDTTYQYKYRMFSPKERQVLRGGVVSRGWWPCYIYIYLPKITNNVNPQVVCFSIYQYISSSSCVTYDNNNVLYCTCTYIALMPGTRTI